MSNREAPTVSKVLPDGQIVEAIFDPTQPSTDLVVSEGESWSVAPHLDLPSGERLIPYSPSNNLILHKVVLLPSGVSEYGTEAELLSNVRAFIHRYVSLSEVFEEIAAHYVLFTWIYDAFNELPYLRVRGDYGSGKSRFLLTVGSLSYKPMFASGASTLSPVFRIIDTFRGTLVLDESDFRASDERADIIKILNNGNARGFPVLRSEQLGQRKEFDVRAYSVFCPKIIATRGDFTDRALESRCLTEEMGQAKLRSDIPINLPASFEEEARELRNRLLLFRLRTLRQERTLGGLLSESIEPRLRQVFSPLLSVVSDAKVREEVVALAARYQRDLVADRGLSVEAAVLEAIRDLRAAGRSLGLQDIARAVSETQGEELSPRRIGAVLRRRLGIRPRKSHGTFVVPVGEVPKLERLFERYGVDLPAAGAPSAFEGF